VNLAAQSVGYELELSAQRRRFRPVSRTKNARFVEHPHGYTYDKVFLSAHFSGVGARSVKSYPLDINMAATRSQRNAPKASTTKGKASAAKARKVPTTK